MLKPSLQEWLEVDGLGGFSSSTTSGIHTRRYHGWLFTAGREPGERWLCLSKLEDSLEGPGGKWNLSSNLYPGATHPDGLSNVWAFYKDPFPTFIYKVGKNFVVREIFMVKGRPGVFCVYRIKDCSELTGSEVFTLTLRPLCNSRFYHYTAKEGSWSPQIHSADADSFAVLEGHAVGDLALVCSSGTFTLDSKWYKDMVYPVERRRGLDYIEDHLSPGYFTARIRPGDEVVFWAGFISKEKDLVFKQFCSNLKAITAKHREWELNRRNDIRKTAGESKILGELYLAGDQFIVKNNDDTSIIAGFHWFGEWGRDTFISLPGLLLCTGRFAQAREVFSRFGNSVSKGLIPNRFAEGEGAAYNSADASLWFVDALGKYEEISGDTEFPLTLFQVVHDIVRSYAAGTDFGIFMDPSGLLVTGSQDTQLTWMDACAYGHPVTPRAGCPVEINALWIRALVLYARWAERLQARNGHFKNVSTGVTSSLAEKARKRFLTEFVWPGVGLYDRIDALGPVPEIRPNQLIAASIKELRLPRHVLTQIWTTAFEKLVSPGGIRTLAPFSQNYRGKYGGPPQERDSAYHQGTAWPWLYGPFFDLAGRLDLNSISNLLISRLLDLESNPCVGTVYEVASGDLPYEPGGSVAQAWSVSELIRVVSHQKTVHAGPKQT